LLWTIVVTESHVDNTELITFSQPLIELELSGLNGNERLSPGLPLIDPEAFYFEGIRGMSSSLDTPPG
jgi:hypothetical protein